MVGKGNTFLLQFGVSVLEIYATGSDILLCYSEMNVAKFQIWCTGSLSVTMSGYYHHSSLHLRCDPSKTPGRGKAWKVAGWIATQRSLQRLDTHREHRCFQQRNSHSRKGVASKIGVIKTAWGPQALKLLIHAETVWFSDSKNVPITGMGAYWEFLTFWRQGILKNIATKLAIT